MNALQKVYQEDAVHLVDEKVKFLGLQPETDITPRSTDNGFKVWTSVIKSNDQLKKIGVNNGDKLLVFQSLRYTKKSLEYELKNEVCIFFDIGSSFIASIIRT